MDGEGQPGAVKVDVHAAALDLAYRYIGARERTVAEVQARLARAGFESAQVGDAVEELRALGCLDDARYARLFAADKRLLEQWGTERIERELVRRGVDRESIDAALCEPEGRERELERAVGLVGRRWDGRPWDRRERDRALGVLLRKGYDSELALRAIEAVVAREGTRTGS